MPSLNPRLASLSREQYLDLSTPNKLEYFDSIVVKHPRMTASLADLITLSDRHAGSDIVLLIGPTGVGKSATVSASVDALNRKFAAKMLEDSSIIPVICVEAPASGEQAFSWRIQYTNFLEALSEPLINRKITTEVEDGKWRIANSSGRSTVAALRTSTQRTLKNRDTRVVIVDEAVHLLANTTKEKLKSHMNALKSLSNVRGVTLVLVGSYDLYELLTLSGQLARRSQILHMNRYLTGVASDEAAFRKALHTLQMRLPLKEVPDLSPFSSVLQSTCIGCVGTLKDTLTRALCLSLENNGAWKPDYLRRALLSERQVASILEETLEGEKSLGSAAYGSRSINDLALA
jgi:hypothetical protein